jgi:Right handed beta helix region
MVGRARGGSVRTSVRLNTEAEKELAREGGPPQAQEAHAVAPSLRPSLHGVYHSAIPAIPPLPAVPVRTLVLLAVALIAALSGGSVSRADDDAAARVLQRSAARHVGATRLLAAPAPLASPGGLWAAQERTGISGTRPSGFRCPTRSGRASRRQGTRRNCRYVSPSGADTNPGTYARPWRTIGKAQRALRPGQTAYARPGVYAEELSGPCDSSYNALDWAASGSRDRPITISGYPGTGRAVVVRTKIKLSGNYLRLKNLIVDRNSAYSVADDGCTGDPNITIYGTDNQVVGVEIRNSNMSGMYISGADRALIVRNWIHDNGTHLGQDHGIYFGSGDGGVIADNVIDSNAGFGIHMYPHPVGQVVAHNTIVRSARAGIILSGSREIVVANNIVAWNTREGIRTHGDGCAGCSAVKNLLFRNSEDYYLPEPLSVISTVRGNPRFVDAGRGNYHLRANSPAIDAAAEGYGPSTDFDGRRRPSGAKPDIGAFER